MKTQANWDIFLVYFKDFTLNNQKDLAPLSIPASEIWEKPKLQLKADYLNHFIVPTENEMSAQVRETLEAVHTPYLFTS